MFRKLNKNKRGQNTAEYALLISLVVAAIIAMQTYAQRTLQARIRDAAQYLVNGTGDLGNSTVQYEPYYLESDYGITRNATENTRLGENQVAYDETSNRVRGSGGITASAYNGINGE